MRAWLGLFAIVVGGVAQAAPRGAIVRVPRPLPSMVMVPAGTFTMGVAPDDAEVGLEDYCSFLSYPALCRACLEVVPVGVSNLCTEEYVEETLAQMAPRQVYLDAFTIDRTEVTTDAYRQCVAAGGCTADALILGDPRYLGPGLPMVNVTWHDARDFCRWRGARLPTEAEWEKAARGDGAASGPWPWGGSDRGDDFNHGRVPDETLRALDGVRGRFFDDQQGLPDATDGAEFAAPPGSYPWGAGPYGTVDQAGNVAEWVEDVWTAQGYAGLSTVRPVRDGAPTEGTPHVVRGGSWRQAPFLARVDLRDPLGVTFGGDRRFPFVGFRCARDA
ncbi:MAG: formylglycine-generating enzyme family protein [Kofleriaceae bacterium]